MHAFAIVLSILQFVSPAAAQTAIVSGTDCSRLVRHVPAGDVAYRPGVDARGRSVAPADLNPAPQIQVPDRIVFDVRADLRRFGVPANSPLYEPSVAVGTVAVLPDGRVMFNGLPLGDPEIAALAELCRQRGATR